MSDNTSGAAGGRVSGVSTKILEILAGGPRSTADLISEGGFSAAAAFLNLKKLKEQGAVEGERAGKSVNYRLADASAVVSEAPRRGRKKGSKNKSPAAAKKAGKPGPKSTPAVTGGSLSAALAAIADRFSPVADLDRKVNVLDELSKSLPREVATVLKDIRADLLARSKA
ncbi:helix-turn-helix domain-containing protein [Nevskia ramosa]|uniref:helix-turn-helix domain-containing protein n=1 Tax=Nevskia ramosa TaxID=64002 RepID=UPI003D124239